PAPRSRLRTMLQRDIEETLPIEQPARWDVSLHADHNSEVPQSDFGIESRLTLPARPDLPGPPTTPTEAIFNTRTRTSRTSTTPATAAASAGPSSSTGQTTTAAIP